MARIYEKAYLKDKIVPMGDAQLSVASSAVLYGLSVYTVFQVSATKNGLCAFRLEDHFKRLINSSRIIGIDTFEKEWNYKKFEEVVRELVQENHINEDVFVRATVHVDELVAGTRSRGLSTSLSIFIYEAKPILPKSGAKLKTSVWRRVPDNSIPSRAKVNGAYVNSVLAKQDAIDSGYDDCIFLDANGHVCELSAANIFLVRNGILITPGVSTDLLEGLNRKTVLEIAKSLNIKTEERNVDLTELYIADEIFASGTSAFISSVSKVDNRMVGDGAVGSMTKIIQDKHSSILHGDDSEFEHLLVKM